MSVLRRAHVPVEPDITGFDEKLREKFTKADPGGKAGKQLGGQLNRALKRLDLDPVDVRADPRKALAAISETEAKLRALARSASTVEIKVRAEQGLSEIDRFRKKVGDLGEESATGFAANFQQRLGPLLAKAPASPAVLAGLGILGAAVAPTLGAAVAGGIVGGVGSGGVVGGLALASRDERVTAEASKLSKRVTDRLLGSAGVFVQPALAGLKEIQAAVDTVGVENIFRDSARYVPLLTRGISSAIKDIGAGIEAVVGKSGPAVGALGRMVAGIGQQVGESLRLLSDDADEGASALDDLTLAMSNVIQVSAGVVHGLAVVKGGLDDFDDGIDSGRRGLEDFFTKMAGGRAEFDITADGMGVAEARAKALADQEKKLGEEQTVLADRIKLVVDAEAKRKAGQAALTTAQKELSGAQEAYSTSLLDGLVPGLTRATQVTDGLRRAADSLFGRQIAGVEANEAYAASWDSLSESVKSNGRSLNINTEAGRANRDQLQALLGASNEMYYADINAGVAIDEARKKHEKRTTAIRAEAGQLTRNKTETDKLISTYGQIPPTRATDLVVRGLAGIESALNKVYIAQRALAEGKTINEVRYEGTAAMRSVFADGGHVRGPGGPRGDKIPAMLSDYEYVVNADSTRKIGVKNLNYLNRYGELPAFANGGFVAPVETRRRIPMNVDVSDSYVMPEALALSKVAPAFGAWPSSPAAQRGDSGVWRKVLQLIKSGPNSGSFGNAYRAGDPKWHGSGRAVDWMGYNQDALAGYLASKHPLELIHRTRNRDYAYTRGKNKGSFNNSLMEAHRNHIHIAMDDGGFRMLQPGMNLIPNGTGKPEPIAGPAGMAAIAGGGMDIGALITELRAVRSAIERNGDVVGRHVRRGIGGVDATLGAAADLYSRTS